MSAYASTLKKIGKKKEKKKKEFLLSSEIDHNIHYRNRDLGRN